MKRVEHMTAAEATDAYNRAIRNMSAREIYLIQGDPNPKEGDSPLVAHAKEALRRSKGLK